MQNDENYRAFVGKLFRGPSEIMEELNRDVQGIKIDLAHAAAGLTGEAGEVGDLIKKHVFTGKTLNREELINELGDVEFYLAAIRSAIEVDREEVLAVNVLKLSKRFPNGFNTADAARQADKEGGE